MKGKTHLTSTQVKKLAYQDLQKMRYEPDHLSLEPPQQDKLFYQGSPMKLGGIQRKMKKGMSHKQFVNRLDIPSDFLPLD